MSHFSNLPSRKRPAALAVRQKPALSKEAFQRWQNFISERTGVFICEGKAYLFENRLLPLLQDFGCRDLDHLYQKALADKSTALVSSIIEVMTTHETSFFRDRWAFELLGDLVDRFIAEGKRDLQVWSAACSTGEEPFSIAMTFKRALEAGRHFRPHILASDIAEKTLQTAMLGSYHHLGSHIRPDEVSRYFTEIGGTWHVNEDLRTMVQFQHLNLMDVEPHLGCFDVVFCRNVAIYFNIEVRRRFFDRLAEVLPRGGVLIIGASESLCNVTKRFQRQEYKGHFYYRRAS